METQNHPRSRYAGKAALIGTALTVALVTPLAGSAALDGGSFFIYAYNDQEPEIDARAGLNGIVRGGNPGGPGGENPTSLTGTVACGDQSLTVTQEMLDFSDKNREILDSGGTAEAWPGADWKFIAAGSYFEAFSGNRPSIPVDTDRAYILSSNPDLGIADYVVPQVAGSIQFTDGQGGPLFQSFSVAGMENATGNKASMIGQLSAKAGEQTMELCSYLKFEGGRVSSSDGAAIHTEQRTITGTDVSGGEVSGYLKNGMPAFGPDQASIVALSERSGFSMTEKTYFRSPNGERWDYPELTGSLWHPLKKEISSTIQGKNREVITDWIDCFGEDCTVKTASPVVARTVTPADDLNPLTVSFGAAKPINGATNILIKKRPNGTILSAEYTNNTVRGLPGENGQLRWEFSRTDGPATFSEDESGGVYSRSYYVDGYAKQNQSQYESAGGTGWLGMYSGGREIHYLGD